MDQRLCLTNSPPGISNPPSRRVFLKYGLGACAAGSLITGIAGKTVIVPYYKAVFDERFQDPRVFAGGATERGIPTASIRGDVTRLFFDDLDLQWKRRPIRLAGYTTPASLFCLDLLARDRGMRVSHYVTNPNVESALGVLYGRIPLCRTANPLPSRDSSRLVFWIIGPKIRIEHNETAGAWSL